MKNILVVPGGGIRGVIPARLGAEIERRLREPLSNRFDYFAGTSTGGIIALCATCPASDTNGDRRPKYSMTEIADLYIKEGGVIFNRGNVVENWIDEFGVFHYKYGAGGIDSVLGKFLGSTLLSGAIRPVMVTAYDIVEDKPHFFLSYSNDPEEGGCEMRFAARSTSAAPTYLPPNGKYVDGGIWCNDPSVWAYMEARKMWPEEKDFFVVTLGTGTKMSGVDPDKAAKWGLAGWARPLIGFLMGGSVEAARMMLEVLLPPDSHIRIDETPIGPSQAMDDASPKNIELLCEFADRVIEQQSGTIESIVRQIKSNS